MGKKYIIELLDECNSEFKGIMVFGLTQEKQISVELIPEESLRPYTEPDLEKIKKEAYEQGLSDAEEGKATCQYCEYEYLDDTKEPCKKCCKAYMNKYKPKAKEEQIQVGDEVIIRNKTAVVTEITDRYVRIMYSDGSCYALFSKGIVKTGRHFPEIVTVLEKMRENK